MVKLVHKHLKINGELVFYAQRELIFFQGVHHVAPPWFCSNPEQRNQTLALQCLCKSPLYSSHCLQPELHRPCRLTAEPGPIEPHFSWWLLCWSKISAQTNSRTNNDELQPKKATKEQQFPNIEHTVHLVEAGIDYIGHASLDATNTTSLQHNFWPTFWPIRGRGTPWKADGHTAVT